VVLAIIPNLASWAAGYIDDALSAAGTSAARLGEGRLASAGVISDGLHALGNGAVLAGMILGAIGVFIIDRRFLRAAAFCMAGAGLAIVGLIHGGEVHVFTNSSIALGYALAGVTCAALCLLRAPYRAPDPTDPADLEAAREAGYRVAEPQGEPPEGDGRLVDAPVPKEPTPV
jgi:AGZA family xanthine/uracil permease-like MFS transporter